MSEHRCRLSFLNRGSSGIASLAPKTRDGGVHANTRGCSPVPDGVDLEEV